MEQRTAIVFGATGLVGNLLLEELEKTGNYSAIRIFVRQSAGISSSGVEEIITDFIHPLLQRPHKRIKAAQAKLLNLLDPDV